MLPTRPAGCDGPRQGQRAIEPFADFLNEREWTDGPGMSASTRSNGNQSICSLVDSLAGKCVVDDIVENDAAANSGKLGVGGQTDPM